MPPRTRAAKQGLPRRRKIALACELCREKKVRCDGQKPICGPCARRSYSIERCVYKVENARSASNDEYLKALHNRILELEDVCAKGGIAVPPRDIQEVDSEKNQLAHQSALLMDTLDTEPRTSAAVEGLLGLGGSPVISGQQDIARTPLPQTASSTAPKTRPEGLYTNLKQDSANSRGISNDLGYNRIENVYPSPSLTSQLNITAMGAISAEDGGTTDSPQTPYYGNSSVASFMRLARESISVQSNMQALQRDGNSLTRNRDRDSGLWKDFNGASQGFQVDDFSLPPRSLADHLLKCYWDRVYCLYPFFHRPSFEKAYENLWESNENIKTPLPQLNIGLGGSFDSKPNSIVFHSALNAIFGIGCHFSDLPVAERETAAYSFFLRAKRFIGLDLLDIATIGVVQTLLIMALLLQSTPYPNRCWNSIGVACRVAQGLGLHEDSARISTKPLEREMRRRTWHGCVIMDMIVSMTFGRPSMTSHVPSIPLPAMGSESPIDDPCKSSGQPCDHRLGYMTFYVSTIELFGILESILSDVYNAWQSRSGKHPESNRGTKHGSLDVIMELDDKLSAYEANVPEVLNWTKAQSSHKANSHQLSILERQRNVLRARFIYLRLLLYRSMFTQLCSDERNGTARRPGFESRSIPGIERNVVYLSVSENCAAACVIAAVDLISLVYKTYRTTVTDAWWYNGFYTSTAGFVLIMSYSCKLMREHIDLQTVNEAWRKCEEILAHMAQFSLSARNSLQFLQTTQQHVVQNYPGASRNDGNIASGFNERYPRRSVDYNPSTEVYNMPQIAEDYDKEPEVTGATVNPLLAWDEVGLGPDELGFLGRFDVPDLASWFSDIPP